MSFEDIGLFSRIHPCLLHFKGCVDRLQGSFWRLQWCFEAGTGTIAQSSNIATWPTMLPHAKRGLSISFADMGLYLRIYRALLQICRFFLWIYRAILRIHWALLRIFKALLRIYTALLRMYRATQLVCLTSHERHTCVIYLYIHTFGEVSRVPHQALLLAHCKNLMNFNKT